MAPEIFLRLDLSLVTPKTFKISPRTESDSKPNENVKKSRFSVLLFEVST